MLIVSLEFIVYPIQKIKHPGIIVRLVEEFTSILEFLFTKVHDKELLSIFQ